MKVLAGFLREEDGQDLVEYALLLALIVLAAVTGLGAFGVAVSETWEGITSSANSYFTS